MKEVIASVAVMVFLILPPAAFARIGETREECAIRYGAPLGEHDGAVWYQTAGFKVSIRFASDRAHEIIYRKATKGAGGVPLAMSNWEIQRFLQRNSAGSIWVDQKLFHADRYWLTEDGKLSASYSDSRCDLTLGVR